MSKRKSKVKDPIPKYGGKSPAPALTIIVVLLMLVGGTLAYIWSTGEGGYGKVEDLARVKCLGCLGLDPVVPGYDGFWTVYPEGHPSEGKEVSHPDLVLEELDKDEVSLLVLFYWGPGCVPCAEQWEDMLEEGIASGPEDGGREGPEYRGDGMRMISVDSSKERDLYLTYLPQQREGVPMTTFIFEDHQERILWYTHFGKMGIEDFRDVVRDVLDYLDDNVKDDYEDISQAD